MSLKTAAIVAATLAACAGGASAATYDFTGSGGAAPSYTFGDLTVTGVWGTGTMLENTVRVNQSSAGLGVTHFLDTNPGQVDRLLNESLRFAFDDEVVLSGLTFGGYEQFDDFDLVVDGDYANAYKFSFADGNPLTGLNLTGTIFSIIASVDAGDFFNGQLFEDAFTVAGLTTADAPTAPVPLPAAGWALVAGLGALGVVRRRKAQA
jgi:hypothetical protein